MSPAASNCGNGRDGRRTRPTQAGKPAPATGLAPTPSPDRARRPAMITGGAGFIGSNLADRLLCHGRSVVIFDDLSRPGVEHNLDWLRTRHGRSHLHVEVADIRDYAALERRVAFAGQVFHFAAQVAVTTSFRRPVEDFSINTIGTLNLLEALRSLRERPPLVFTSTNKVYGGLENVRLCREGKRYEPRQRALRTSGIAEATPLDFHSPYGCSKGAADQYVIDYARTFGLPAVVFRMSCIYGPRQFGTEDQGWIAHFLIRALQGEPITLYGDGCQVRDALFVGDLVDALLLAQAHMQRLGGRAFNIGGGPGNATSLLEVVDRIAALTGRHVEVSLEDWRPGDQRYYVSDTRRFEALTGWCPRVRVGTGIQRLHRWLKRQTSHLPKVPVPKAESI